MFLEYSISAILIALIEIASKIRDMSETNQNQEGQKTIVAFIVGLLVGGLIVWMFSGSPTEAPVTDNDTATTTEVDANGENDQTSDDTSDVTPTPEPTPAPTLEVGDGEVQVNNQPAGRRIALDAVTFPLTEGWIGVRDYSNDRLGGLLGVMRFSESEGLVPEEIVLQRATEPGQEYAIVFYTASDTPGFNLANNMQVDGVFATFMAE